MKTKTKEVPCSYEHCSSHRKHWSCPEETREHRTIKVPIDYFGPAYCSLECQMYHEASLKKEKEAENE